ncbi:MAG: ribonuclease III [Campylobacterales bacterium]
MKHKAKIEELEKRLEYRFKERQHLESALTHRSCKEGENNERLEFLGDAVLDLIVGEHLYLAFPKSSEGELSKIRAALVNERSFARLAGALHLERYIRLSAAEEHNQGRAKPSILSNAFEAVIGAIYLDSGLDEAKRVALSALQSCFPVIDPAELLDDHKTRLQEVTQARFGVIPEYAVVAAVGPDHKKEFEIELLIDGKLFATGRGNSKKAAQQEAARAALISLEKGQQ